MMPPSPHSLPTPPRLDAFAAWAGLFAGLTALGLSLRVLFAWQTDNLALLSAQDWWPAFAGGLRYDLAAAALLALLSAALFGILAACGFRGRGAYAPAVFALSLMQLGDLLYARESGRHVSYEIVEVLGSGGSLWASLPEYWPYLLLLGVLTGGAVLLPAPGREQRRPWWLRAGLAAAVLVFSVYCVRGGVRTVPMSPANAFTLGSPAVSATALNGAYAVLYSLVNHNAAKAPELAAIPADEQRQRIARLLAARPAPSAAPLRPFNVVLVLLESWPAERMHSYGFLQITTPNFDALRAQSLTTRAMVAGGHRTVEGMFSTLCSFQNPARQSVGGSQLLGFDYHCLPRLLGERGWYTAFFQGGHRNSAKLGDLAGRLGFERVFGSEDYNAKLRYEPNSWGVHDADLFDQVEQVRQHLPEPYLLTLNTTTTHDEILPAGVVPAFGMDNPEQRQLSILHFADAQLGELIDRIKHNATRLPTVLVLVADHTARVNSSSFQHYSIPFALYAPEFVGARQLDVAASQRDIAATLVDMAGIDAPWFAGRSLLRPLAGHFADYQHAGRIGWLTGSELVEFSAADGADRQCYDWTRDPLMQQPRTCDAAAIERQRDALAFSRYSMSLLFSGRTTDFAAPITQTAGAMTAAPAAR